SVAAYRFGHTTVRSRYAVNSLHPEVELFDERFGTEGFTSLPTDLVVDWRFLLEVFLGILKHCGTSFLSQKNWKPSACITGRGGKFELADVVRFVQS
ncbi:hypothetical protein JYU13_00890, partial [Gammaproteobacteria bacterium AH-315-M22]|nr:hypothetical protein [Gammaproteobacteria bacterium AH-315-M22]